MKLYKNISKILLGLAVMVVTVSSHAISYQVSNATSTCGSNSHGLWTSWDYRREACSEYFSIEGFLTIDDQSEDSSEWFAVLEATAVNPQGVVADIDLSFSDWADDYNYKRERGAEDTSNIDFFTTMLGTITINGESYDFDSFARGYAFQYGIGANAKDANAFGASAWIQTCQDGVDGACMTSHHWDLNVNLSPVPIPGAVLLFGSALLGLGVVKRRNTMAA